MNYILLAAGRGSRLHPLTLNTPKSMYKLDKNTTILQRMIKKIKKYDDKSKIIIVTGFKRNLIESQVFEKHLEEIIFLNNPFYNITNSIASLWFAKEYLIDSDVTIINADIVMQDELIRDIVCKTNEKPFVLLDSSIKQNGDYNVQVKNERVLVMSKQLENYFGEYAGVTKLDVHSALKLYKKVCSMIENEAYDQWYENCLVQMIFNEDFELFYEDISKFKWTEVDCVEDMLLAKEIHLSEKNEI